MASSAVHPTLCESIRAWIEASCARQGLAPKISDPTVLAKVVRLLRPSGQTTRPGVDLDPAVEAQGVGK